METADREEELKAFLERGNFCRAAHLAQSLNLDPDTIKKYELEALWQMAALYRNALGTKKMAQEFGISKQELARVLNQKLQEVSQKKEARELEPCYDHETGQYLDFEQWMERLFKGWSKLKPN